MADLGLLRSGMPQPQRYDCEIGDPAAILAAQRTAEAQTFLRFARFPTAEAHTTGEATEVVIRDLRFLGRGNFFRITIRLDKNLRPIVERQPD